MKETWSQPRRARPSAQGCPTPAGTGTGSLRVALHTPEQAQGGRPVLPQLPEARAVTPPTSVLTKSTLYISPSSSISSFSHHPCARVSPGYWAHSLEKQKRNLIRKGLTHLRSISIVQEQLPCGRTLHPLSALGARRWKKGTLVTHTSCVPNRRLN